jgi:hypothetical protein
MAGPVDYAKEGAALNKKALMPLFIAAIVMFAVSVVIGIVGGIVGGILGHVWSGLAIIIISAVSAVTQLIMSLLGVSFTKMCIRVRKGETVAPMDVLNVKDFLMPGLLLGAPQAAGALCGILGIVSSGLASLGGLAATIFGILFLWGRFEMALKNVGYMEAWKASVAFWKTNPVGHLIFLIVGGIVSVLMGFIIFGAGASTLCFLLYYTDKTGMQAFTPSTPAVAAAK